MDSSKPGKSFQYRMALAQVMAKLFSGSSATGQSNPSMGTGYHYRSNQPRTKPANKSRLSKRKPHRVLKRR